jgi:dGTPase
MRDFAVRPEQGRGRRHAEPRHPYRTEYQRDRDRIVHSRAFRRLENKTQVFTARFSDHFRNRLTHTIEVSQIARTVAGFMGLNEDLVEALSLAHDIGHPPFGHAGEKRLDQIMQKHGERFDHNLHALRIVESFEQRYAEFPGLNLTFEVREGIIKHSRDYSAREHPELAEYWLDRRPPLEAQLIDLADEIAYDTADLDDGMEAKLLSVDSLRRELPLFEGFLDPVRRKYPSAPLKLQFNEALKAILNYFVTDLMETSLARVEELAFASPDAVRDHPKRLIGFSPAVEPHTRQLRKYLYENLYHHPALASEKEMGAEMVGRLFDFYLEDPERLPRTYAEQAHQKPPHQVICDYIAGMTDPYITKLHEELVGGLPPAEPPPVMNAQARQS